MAERPTARALIRERLDSPVTEAGTAVVVAVTAVLAVLIIVGSYLGGSWA